MGVDVGTRQDHGDVSCQRYFLAHHRGGPRRCGSLDDDVLVFNDVSQRISNLVLFDDDDVVAERPMEDVGHRVRIGDDRHGAVGERARQQQPRVCALFGGEGERVLKGKSSLREKTVARGDNPRIPRLVQVQTARVVPGEKAEGFNRDPRREIEEVQRETNEYVGSHDFAEDVKQEVLLEHLESDAESGETDAADDARHARAARTAQRDLADLVEKGCLAPSGAGRSVRYDLPRSGAEAIS